jgi:glycosyltransferase involved in cell wall biosynthesis
LQLASIVDCAPHHLLLPQQHPERISDNKAERVCNWYVPPFDNPFYGGVMTILRLADSLHREYGIQQRFLICGGSDASEIRVYLSRSFPSLSHADVKVLATAEAISHIPPSDYSIATLWTTAYVLLGVQNTGYKFYLIQDFEPAFYPAGSTYAQAELTYRFGFYGICNTQTLKEMYECDYGGCSVVLEPSIDTNVFHPGGERQSSPKRLFYYARPGTPRNGFELAAAALARVKQTYGTAVDIVCAGAVWKPGDYGLRGLVRTVGLLPYAATGDLYRTCHVGCVMMMTKHPSYIPFELMACGATVVANFNEANTWLLRDGENCLLSPPSTSCLASTLLYALDHHDDLAPIRQKAVDYVLHGMDSWEVSMGKVARFIFNPPAEFQKSVPFGNRFTATKAH